MSLGWLIPIILAELLLLPVLGGLLYWDLSQQADDSQNHPPQSTDAQSNQSTPEERDHAHQADLPEEPSPDELSTSSSSTPEPDGDCERRLRLIRALYFLRGRLEEQGGELLPFERQVIGAATELLSGRDCVNDARLFISPESYLAPPSLDNTYEAEFTRIYGRSPATVLVHSNDEDFVAITNKLGDLTKDQRLDESDLQILRRPTYKAQSILTSDPDLPTCNSDPSVELSGLYFEIDTKYQYLGAVAERHEQCFEIRTFYNSPYNADPETYCWEEEATREARRRQHVVQQHAQPRPPHLAHGTQAAAQQHVNDLHTSRAPPSSPVPTVDEQLHQPEAMGYSNTLFPREAHPHHPPRPRAPPPPPQHPHPLTPTSINHNHPPTPTGSRRQPYSVPYQHPPTTSPTTRTESQQDPTSQRPLQPPLGPNRSGTWSMLESFIVGPRGSKQEKKKAERRRKEE